MKRSLLIFLPAAAIILTRCTDVVQVKLDEGSKIYVVDAFINDLPSLQTVRLTTNDQYFSNSEPPGLTGAQVTVTDLTASRDFQFNYSGDGRYVYSPSGAPMCVAGHQYQLRVSVDGYDYTAITIQKRPASIDSIGIFRGGFGPPNPNARDTVYRCRLYAKDRADNNPDYYWVKTFRNDSLLLRPIDINVSIDGTNGEVYNIPVDSTDFTEPIVFLGFAGFKPRSKCRVEIHSLTKENYFWFVQAAQQINNGGLFATTPENVKTNIVTPSGAKIKATGRFNVASVAVRETRIP